jgi:hypothetical protein
MALSSDMSFLGIFCMVRDLVHGFQAESTDLGMREAMILPTSMDLAILGDVTALQIDVQLPEKSCVQSSNVNHSP